MTLTAVTSYEISLWLHITAVMVGFGATFAEAIMFPVALKTGVKHLPYVHRLQLAINQYLATPALVIVLATGFYQQADGDWELGKFWLSGTITIVVIIGGLLGAYFIPSDRKLGPMVEREIAALGDRERSSSRTSRPSTSAAGGCRGSSARSPGSSSIAAVYLMVAKPGL